MNALSIALCVVCGPSLRSGVSVESSSAYCGLYSIKATASVLGVNVDMKDLISPDYFHNGSSTSEDLTRAMKSVGLMGEARKGLNMASLRQADCPIILHVRASGYNRRFRHWIVFLGFTDDGQVRIYDPPQSRADLSVSELLSMWDGVGILVGREGEQPQRLAVPVEWILIGSLSGVFLVLTRKGRPLLRIVLCTFVCSLFFHLTVPSGFIGSRRALGNVQSAHFQPELPEIDYDELATMRLLPNAVIVDTRLPSAFSSGHIEGAINLPVTSGYVALRTFMNRVPRDSRIVVYCQSEGCGWSDSIGSIFANYEYRNVYVYRGGMHDWQSRRESK